MGGGGYESWMLWEGIRPGTADIGTCATPEQRTWGQKKTWDAEAHEESGEARGSSFASARVRAGAQTYTHTQRQILGQLQSRLTSSLGQCWEKCAVRCERDSEPPKT